MHRILIRESNMEKLKLSLFEFDKGFELQDLCGVDEAGRGPLAGDVYAAAVILPVGCTIEGLSDSKKLTEKKRELLFDEIISKALYYCIATATIAEIEHINILNASMLAMQRAVDGLGICPELVLVDGNKLPKWDYNARDIVKGDDTSACIAAASILAKVARDRYMKGLDETYPQYQFSKHKGYGTKLHYQMLEEHGISDVHRRSFLKKLLGEEVPTKSKNKRQTGMSGEESAARYLIKKGYVIVERNYYGTGGEIDIIAVKDNVIAFVEVKLRTSELVQPQDAVTKSKRQKLIKTAEEYTSKHGYQNYCSFDIIEILLKDKKILVHHIVNAFDASK